MSGRTSKPKATRRGLVELCGGRFAIVPAEIIENPEISSAALRFYAYALGRAKADGKATFRLAAYAKRLKLGRRTAQRHCLECEAAGLVQKLGDDDRMIQTFLVNRDPADRKSAKVGNRLAITKRQERKRTRASREPQLALRPASQMTHPRCVTNDAQEQDSEQEPPYPLAPHPAGGEVGAKAARQANRASGISATSDWHPTMDEVDQIAGLRKRSRQEVWLEVIAATPQERLAMRTELLRWRSVA